MKKNLDISFITPPQWTPEQQLEAKVIIQSFVDTSFFDKTDPERDKIIWLKKKAKDLLGNQ